jgi:hypothetical protein
MIELTFQGQPGRVYYLQRATHLDGPWALLRTLPGPQTPGPVRIWEEVGIEPGAFYRLVVVPAP